MRRISRLIMAAMAMSTCWGAYAANHQATINIDSRIRHQHVTGFGGFSPSPTWQYWLGNNEMDKLFGKGDDQLGLNILRLYMANNTNSWSAGVANAKRAKQHGAFIFASPWSPPASWKTNKSDSDGGELLEDRYDDWAKMLNNYYLFMKEQGVEIDAVSVQNEPDWKASYQSCIWTGEQMAKFLRENGHLIQCKIIAPEAIHFSRNMHEPILNDDKACENLDIMGGHFYGWDGSSYPLAAAKGKEVWMTEYLINERQQNQGLDIDWQNDGMLFARSINDAMLANMSAWVHYSLKRYYGCLGDGSYGTVNNAITKRGYILSHYAKYASGTTRIGHTVIDGTSQLTASAYLSQTGDSVIVMVINPSANSYETSIVLPFNTLGGKQITTTEQVSAKRTDIAYDYETETAVIEIEPYSVNTYIMERSSNRNDIGDIEVKDVVYTDNFDLYGAGCVPPGWIAKADEGIRQPGDYNLGPRIMSFSAEGLMTHAFYFRSNTSGVGYVTYGKDANNPLTLEPGNYTLTYSVVGWKGTPEITTKVTKSTNHIVASEKVTPATHIDSNGSASRITSTTTSSLDFEIAEAGDYLLRWEIARAGDGYKEALLGNIQLSKQPKTSEDSSITSVGVDPVSTGVTYDLMGRRVDNPTRPGIYIRDGKKIYITK